MNHARSSTGEKKSKGLKFRHAIKWVKLKNKHFLRIFLGFLFILVFVIIPCVLVSIYFLINNGRIYPGIYLGDIYVGGLTIKEAENKILQQIPTDKKTGLNLVSSSHEFFLSPDEINLTYPLTENVLKAYTIGRSGAIVNDVFQIVNAKFYTKRLPLSYSYDKTSFDNFLASVNSNLSYDPIYPGASLENGQIVIQKGSLGIQVDIDGAKKKIFQRFETGNLNQDIPIYTEIEGTVLKDEDSQKLKLQAEKLLGKSLVLYLDDYTKIYKDNDLLNLLSYPNNDKKIQSAVTDISANLDKDATEPVLVVSSENTKRVTSFSPPSDGIEVKQTDLIHQISNQIAFLTSTEQKEIRIEIPVSKTKPKFEAGDINNLGINTLLGRGTSKFRGSIPSRVHNVSLAASKINGVLIAPGETFSFNDAVGDISKFTGYKEAYIIQDGKTVLGDGGGVCQVSTTLFRAVMDAGLPITERHGHSYRVTYYEQDAGAGLDATVFAPSTDFKFINDTPSYILIQTYVNQKDMTAHFEIYGTSDGRKSTVSKPIVYDQVPPPEDLYIDDPTLPAGEIKQIDHKAWGAKAKFDYTVTRDGEAIYQKTFLTVYKSWQAKFLRGTGV